MRSYHDSVPETPPNAQTFEDKARKQDDYILTVFEEGGDYTPSEMQRRLERLGIRWPLTSIRRAITNLTQDRRLVQTDHRREGLYGRDERVWRIRYAKPQQGGLF